jgi:hypothetical protein
VDLSTLKARAQERLTSLLAERQTHTDELTAMRAAVESGDAAVTIESIQGVAAKRALVDADIDKARGEVAELDREIAREAEIAELAERQAPAAPAYDQVARVGREERTYRPDNDPKGVGFALDVARAFKGDWNAQDRLRQHMSEEQVERGMDSFERAEAGSTTTRAIGSGALTGIVVPSYLTDQFGPFPRAARPLADAMNRHELPPTGMSAFIGKLTTGTTAAEQTSENSAVSETNADDTLLTVPILTSSGSQTISRQGIERGVGVEDTIIGDLVAAQRTNLDSLIINRASTGLTNVATAIAYTDATPTAAELYPKLLQGPAAVEAAMLNSHPGDTLAVMHSRRWYWLNSQLTSTWPLFGQPGAPINTAGAAADMQQYGNGLRGVLPAGTPIIVDNNIATNLGAGTNEDEIYFVSQREAHLWEDPNAPVLIRAEQTSAKSLGVDLVVYAYFAYLFTRVTHAQKVNGTGLVTPTF